MLPVGVYTSTSLVNAVVLTKHPAAPENVSDTIEKESPSPHVGAAALGAGAGMGDVAVGAGNAGLDAGATAIGDGDGPEHPQMTRISPSSTTDAELSPLRSPI